MENLAQRMSANLISKMLIQGSQKIELCQFVLKLLIIHVFQRILCVLNSISIKSVGATSRLHPHLRDPRDTEDSTTIVE